MVLGQVRDEGISANCKGLTTNGGCASVNGVSVSHLMKSDAKSRFFASCRVGGHTASKEVRHDNLG